MALSTSLLLTYLKIIHAKIYDAKTMSELNRWIALGVYSVVTYLVSLRGSEGFLLDLGGLKLHKVDDETKQNYFLIPLLGKVNVEQYDRCHLLPCAMITDSGIKPNDWVKMLMILKKKQGLTNGPAISDDQRRVLNSSNIDQSMHKILILNQIKSREDIKANYHAFRSFRRSSDTTAINRGVR
jgi:hypothetical protein